MVRHNGFHMYGIAEFASMLPAVLDYTVSIEDEVGAIVSSTSGLKYADMVGILSKPYWSTKVWLTNMYMTGGGREFNLVFRRCETC